MTSPHQETVARLARWRQAAERADRDDSRIAAARLAVFAAALALGWGALAGPHLSPWWLALPAAAFLALVLRHQRVLDGAARARRACALHQRTLERLEGRFAGQGPAGHVGVAAGGPRFAAPEHPYAVDLDLFGPGSLFELLCAARTAPGEARLASWLLGPAGVEEVRARQAAVAELAPRVDLREALALLGEDVSAAVDADRLAAWAGRPTSRRGGPEAPPVPPLAPGQPHPAAPALAPLLPSWLGAVAGGLAAANVALALAWALELTGAAPLAVTLAATAALGVALRPRLAEVLGGLERPVAELRVLALLLARLETERFEAPRLRGPQQALGGAGPGQRPASAQVAGLAALQARLESARNQLLAPLAFALCWGPLHAVALERWRARHGAAVGRWLDAVADLEALSSLAGHAWEQPGSAVPELLDPRAGPGGARLLGQALRHPLLPGAVPNDVRLGGDGPALLLVSGSNMSGKSTYLRTVGVNVVLALAGARVPAARLALTPLQLGATLRIQDSLLTGRSRFYAEIERLKLLQDLAARTPPLLALLDEILHGTNSHDRRVGAEALLRGLAARGALGVITTHDLALTGLAGIANGHFEDQVRDGALAFDFRLREGVVGHSNALALMRAVGLDV